MEKQNTQGNGIEKLLDIFVSEEFETYANIVIRGLFLFLVIAGIPYVAYLLYTLVSAL
ncbi:DUF3930 family protein [Bacillus sp. 165]|uniref:DUF3930 family protein n=1 Tax=Bacillus sp. 165 TaxID=1529117 RepID=UPI001ADB3831|nr:DUF3930 family protein [Bacillus sp. 165]MBO9129300.1 DUF3930 family protein [Bacillus sp. 165]